MIEVDWAAVAAFKQTPEYQRLGVLGRERLLYETFPELAARHRALSARHQERVLHDGAITPDPDQED